MARFRCRYALIGVLFGVCFPVIATLFELWKQSTPRTWNNITELHRTNQLLWIINMAPLYLGLVATFAGWKQDKLCKLTLTQESIIQDKTKDLLNRNSQFTEEIRQRKQLTTELIIAKQGSGMRTQG